MLHAIRLTRNFGWLALGELAAKVFGFFAFAYLARVLGPGDFGQLEFALALIFFFTLLVDSGLTAIGGREIAKNESALKQYTIHIIALRFLLAVGAYALLAAGVALSGKPWPIKKLLLLYGLTLMTLPALLPFVFQGRELMRTIATASVIRWGLFAGGVFFFVQGPGEIWAVPLVDGGALVCVGVFYLVSFSRFFGSIRQKIDARLLWKIWRQALPLGGSELVWALKVYFATVLLGSLIQGPEVGWFGAAHRIVISLHSFVWLYFFNLLPVLARSAQKVSDDIRRLFRVSLVLTAAGGLSVGIVGTVFAGPIISLIYGSQYGEAAAVLKILVWLLPLALMSGHYRYLLIGYSRQDLEFVGAAAGGTVNVALNILLTPAYGIQAAAWFLIASEIVIWGVTYYFARTAIGQNRRAATFSPLPALDHER